MLQRIEKSVFRKGEYVGYAHGCVWHIRKSSSSYGRWTAWCQKHIDCAYGWTLKDLDEKLGSL